jgi:hypothetical protein
MLRLFGLVLCLAAKCCSQPPTRDEWFPELDESAGEEQRALYDTVRHALPSLKTSGYPVDSVRVYVFPGTGGDRTSCTDNTAPLYWVWYDTVHLVPILSGFRSNGCANADPTRCSEQKRYSGSFYTCKISGVATSSYTHSGFDRGHMVNSQAMARLYEASCQTFNMCNIAPQSPQMNQKDWLAAEVLTQARVEATGGVIVMQGSLLAAKAAEHHCVCGEAEGGTIPCSQVKEAGCNGKDLEISVPAGFFKVILDEAAKSSWSFVYSKAQSQVGPQPTCTGTCETPADAFVGGDGVWQRLGVPAHFATWPAVTSTASPSCSFCTELYNATLYEGPLVPEPAMYDTDPEV